MINGPVIHPADGDKGHMIHDEHYEITLMKVMDIPIAIFIITS